MSSDRKKLGVAFWATVVLALPVLYVASFWPAMAAMNLMLEAGWINEGGQVIFGLIYYPLWRTLGY